MHLERIPIVANLSFTIIFMSNPTKSLWYHLRVACQSRQRSMNRALKQFDITHAQYMVMQYLSRAHINDVLKWLSQNKIAQELGLDPMMISNILTLLEKKKYIVRQKSASGMPIVKLWLSKMGQDLIAKAHEAVATVEEQLFDTKDPKKLKKHLKKVIASDE